MAAYVRFIRRTAPEAGAVNLIDIDDELCRLLEVEPHPVKYVLGWYDTIAFWLAVGESWEQIEERHKQWCSGSSDLYYVELSKLREYLKEHFYIECWSGR